MLVVLLIQRGRALKQQLKALWGFLFQWVERKYLKFALETLLVQNDFIREFNSLLL